MGLKDKLSKFSSDLFIKRYGDRMTQVQGNVVSIKIEKKSILWVFNKLIVTLIIKPERSKNIVRCVYTKKRWFKKPEFMIINQGNSVIIQGTKGLKGKENRETIQIMNIMNLTTKKDLVPMEGNKPKKIKQTRKYR